MSFPTGDRSDCDCEGVAQFLTSIPIAGGLAMEAYTIDLRCTITLNIKVTWDDGEVAWVSEPFNIILESGGSNVSCILTMTSVGTAPGDVEVLLDREAGGDVAKWVNKPLWQPHRAVRMKRVWHDLTCTAVSWNPYPCLKPSGVVGCGSNVGLDVRYWLVRVPENPNPGGWPSSVLALLPTEALGGGACLYRGVHPEAGAYTIDADSLTLFLSPLFGGGVAVGDLGDNPAWDPVDDFPPVGWWDWPDGFPSLEDHRVMGVYDDEDEVTALDCTGCDPEEVTANKTFTISDVEYTIEKGGTSGDECDGHCWGNGPDITLTWTDGVWELHYFSTIYVVEAGACERTLFMDKFSGSGPDTLTVYG